MAKNETQPEARRNLVLRVGAFMMGTGVLMGFIVVSMFTMTTAPPRFLERVGGICFWGYLPILCIGTSLLIIGAMRGNAHRRSTDLRKSKSPRPA